MDSKDLEVQEDKVNIQYLDFVLLLMKTDIQIHMVEKENILVHLG